MQRPFPATRVEPSRLLVRGVNWLGDAVMTTPALSRLRQGFAQADISMLVDERIADLWTGHPSVNTLIRFKQKEGPWSIAARLRDQKFDVALILPNSPRSALECWLAGIPQRVGYAGHWRRWLLTRRVQPLPGQVRPHRRRAGEIRRLLRDHGSDVARPEAYTHQVYDYLRLGAALGADPSAVPPRVEVPALELKSAMIRLREMLQARKPAGASQEPVWLGINATAAYGPAKCWPLERFAAVAREVSGRVPGCIWLSFGTGSERDKGERLAGLGRGCIMNLAGKTSLRELMSLLRACRVLLTNDSGPMHLAAALGTPVVVPFGSTSPELTGPGEPGDPRHRLLRGIAPCSPCFRRTCPVDFRCMTSISVEQVVEAVLESLCGSVPS